MRWDKVYLPTPPSWPEDFFFNGFHFCAISKNSLFNPRSRRLFPMLLFRSFMSLGFTCRFMVHFELIFVLGVNKNPNLSLWIWTFSLPQYHLLKRMNCLHLCWKSIDRISVLLPLNYLFSSIDWCLTSGPLTHYVEFGSFIVRLEIRKCESFNLALLWTCFSFSSALYFHKNFQTNPSLSIF